MLGHYWPLKTHCLVYQQFILYIFPTKQMRKHVQYKWANDSSCSPSPAWNIPTLISNCYLKCVKRFISISFSFNLKIPNYTGTAASRPLDCVRVCTHRFWASGTWGCSRTSPPAPWSEASPHWGASPHSHPFQTHNGKNTHIQNVQIIQLYRYYPEN